MELDKRGFVRLNTLRDYLERGHTISAHCTRTSPVCTHWRVLDLNMLAQRLGWEFEPVRDRELLLRRLVCEKCGHRGASFIMGVLNAPTVGAAHHYPPSIGTTDQPSPLYPKKRRSRKRPPSV